MENLSSRPGDCKRYVAMKNQLYIPLVLGLLAALLGCTGSSTETRPKLPNSTPTILSNKYTVNQNGIGMQLHRKQLSDTNANEDNTLILLPSATYSTAPNWDLQFNDSSIMDFFAESGWVVFALDLPGYGKSGNPPNPETFGAIESAEYINAAVEFICEKEAIESINLLGWSWGAQAAGRFANEFPRRVNKLVLYGFNYQMRFPKDALPQDPYREIDFEGALADFIDGCYEGDVPRKYASVVMESDKDNLVPAGPIHDYVNRLPVVEPTRLPMPVLVICGQFELEQPPNVDGDYGDFFEARKHDLEAFCNQLPNGKHEVVIVAGGGHAVHLEKPKNEWRRRVVEFFEEK
jgi:pimeloyl-ACP methyl ester carboxylesterase